MFVESIKFVFGFHESNLNFSCMENETFLLHVFQLKRDIYFVELNLKNAQFYMINICTNLVEMRIFP